jgi:hypothetical protein
MKTKQGKSIIKPRSNRPGRRETHIPPQINTHPIQVRVFRFQGGAEATSYSITRRCLLSLYACQATTVLCYTAIQAIRIKRVSMWAPSTLPMASITLEWTDIHAPATQITATGTPTFPAHLMSRPPPNCFADLWSQVTTGATSAIVNEVLFTISTQEYTVVDVECEVVYSDGTNANLETLARNTTATVVAFGYSYLDNSSVAGGAGTNQLIPICDNILVYTS